VAGTDPNLEWLGHVQPIGVVLAPMVLARHGLNPEEQTRADSEAVRVLLSDKDDGPALPDPWAFFQQILGWRAAQVGGATGGTALPPKLSVRIEESETELIPHWAVVDPDDGWQILVRIEAPGVKPEARGALEGWEATPHQRLERLLRETGVPTGLLITDGTLRFIQAPRGETSGWMSFPLRSLREVGGRPMLGGLKLILSSFRLHNDAPNRRLPALLKASRDAQAEVSTKLASQVLGALHELLRGLHSADRVRIEDLAASRPEHLYEGLLTVLLRLVFLLYAEDRDLIPSRIDAEARALYEGYGVRALYARLLDNAAHHPDTMDERRGAWSRLLALFRLVYRGDASGWIRGRGGKLFDPEAFLFLQGQDGPTDPPAPAVVSDGCILRILDLLLSLDGERLSYRTLDVEQIGSVYETVMGFRVETRPGPTLAIRAGKNDKTPVFVDVAALATKKGSERAKFLKEKADRHALSDKVARALSAATDAAGVIEALRPIVDERGSPGAHVAPSGTPLLQPTDERRRTGSHYTPRSLTAPIVKHALEPAFERLGPDVTPEHVLDLKVCDPAMGSGAFLVEVCRAIGERLVTAWARWPETRPTLPADEDDALHARRLVAQRCLYGVDRNPGAVDLARLSLWLATLARDHEFTFLDHALKSGDSLVGLMQTQIVAVHWDASKPGLPLFRQLVKDRVDEAMRGRAEIQSAPDDTARAIQEGRHRTLEARLAGIRILGNAVIATFLSADTVKARETARQKVESVLSGAMDAVAWDKLREIAESLHKGAHHLVPFHWQIEFPEVFAREHGGFDAIVGNPPFAGKNTIISGNRENYLPWLRTLHVGAHGNADLVAHFFRRAFSLLRAGGAFGLIATNTIGQGDTRASGLTTILSHGGAILRATRRMKWPGAAAVTVSLVHVVKGEAPSAVLEGQQVRRISAYLVEGDLDTSPAALAANAGKSFQGSIVLSMGFTFDDAAAAKGDAESLTTMRELIVKNPRNHERIFPYIGGEEVNTDPRHAHHRYVIDFADFPLKRCSMTKAWAAMTAHEREDTLRKGEVPTDYPDPVAADWPDLLETLERRAKPQRLKQNDKLGQQVWWRFLRRRNRLYTVIARLERVLVVSRVTEHLGIAKLPNPQVYADRLVVFPFESLAAFAAIQSRIHELWARSFSATMEDRLLYAPSDCFRTFPFPEFFETNLTLEAVGETYHDFRAELMVERNEGLTKTYNRFHARGQNAPDIARLRELHTEMDAAVLRAYGWDDLAARATPEFIEQEADEGRAPKTRLDWPAEFKDEVLARLLALNAARAGAERAAGLGGLAEDEEDAIDEEVDA
jgi:N-6 DNA Methylase